MHYILLQLPYQRCCGPLRIVTRACSVSIGRSPSTRRVANKQLLGKAPKQHCVDGGRSYLGKMSKISRGGVYIFLGGGDVDHFHLFWGVYMKLNQFLNL